MRLALFCTASVWRLSNSFRKTPPRRSADDIELQKRRRTPQKRPVTPAIPTRPKYRPGGSSRVLRFSCCPPRRNLRTILGNLDNRNRKLHVAKIALGAASPAHPASSLRIYQDVTGPAAFWAKHVGVIVAGIVGNLIADVNHFSTPRISARVVVVPPAASLAGVSYFVHRTSLARLHMSPLLVVCVSRFRHRSLRRSR